MLITPLGLVFTASVCRGGVLGLWGPAGFGVWWVFPAWPGRLTGRLQRLGTWGACLLVWGRRYNHYRMDEMIRHIPAGAGRQRRWPWWLYLLVGGIPARAGELVMSLAERHGLEYPCWRGLALQPGSTSPPLTGSMS